MATIPCKGLVFMELDSNEESEWKPVWMPTLWKCRVDESETRVFIGEKTFMVEVPDDFDPRGRQIAALEKEKRDITAAFQRRVTEINGQIANLQAITFDGAAA